MPKRAPCASCAVVAFVICLGSSCTTAAPVVVVQSSQLNDCAPMIGADFACIQTEGPDFDACQVQNAANPSELCSRISGCSVAVQSGQWTTFKSAVDFSALPEPAQGVCAALASAALNAVGSRRTCIGNTAKWISHGCVKGGRAVAAARQAIPARPAQISAFMPSSVSSASFGCVPSMQVAEQHTKPMKLSASPNCMRPSPTPNPRACSFPLQRAFELCEGLLACGMLYCERLQDYCEVLQGDFSDRVTQPSFGEGDLYVRRTHVHNGTDYVRPPQTCANRHYTFTARLLGSSSAYYSAQSQTLACQGSSCTKMASSASDTDAAMARVRTLLITAAQRYLYKSTADEPLDEVISKPSPLLIFPPAPASVGEAESSAEATIYRTELIADRTLEAVAYRARYQGDQWMSDVQEVERQRLTTHSI